MSGKTTVLFERRCRQCGAPMKTGVAFCAQCGASEASRADDPLLQEVQALFGTDVTISHELGRGAMAVVYAAIDTTLDRKVAVKVLLPELAEQTDMAERFRREARTVAALQHPNVVAVYGVRSNERISAIVMQFVEGRSLDDAMSGGQPLPLPVAGLVLAEVAGALQHAHERGIVHRDVKPANVLLGNDGRAIVSDFGIARREGGQQLTGTGVVIGTVAYMSPEQCFGQTVTPASDQYSLGVLAYELLGGQLPFTGALSDILRAHAYDPPRPLAEVRPGLPVSVTTWVMRALEKKPEDRNPNLKDAERVFRSLVQDSKGASTVIAAMSAQVRERAAKKRNAEASTIIAAVPKLWVRL